MIVDIALAAEEDLADGYWFYERQHAGLGDYFRSNLIADIESPAMTGGISRRVPPRFAPIPVSSSFLFWLRVYATASSNRTGGGGEPICLRRRRNS
jgi:hypothetical protein